MVSWWADQPYLSLYLQDKPLFYNTSRGREVSFELHYKGTPGPAGSNDIAQPAIFGVGTNWHTPWRSYLYELPITDTPVYLFLGDGSARIYYVNRHDVASRALLTKDGNTYTLTFADGSRNIYDTWVTLDGDSYAFLTAKQDAVNNEMAFSYSYTSSGGVTNSIRLNQITDVDNNTISFTYTNNSYYSNLLVKVSAPHGLTNSMAYDSTGQLTNITDVVGLKSGMVYDSSQRVSKLTTPYGTTTFSYYADSGWKALRVEELGLRHHLYLEGYDAANVWPTAISESMSLASFLADNGISEMVQTNSFDQRNTFYWGPLQYQNLPSSVRTALTNQPSTFDPANLTTNDYQLGWTRHWLKAYTEGTNNYTGLAKSMDRAPSPLADGSTQGAITYYDYAEKSAHGREYEGSLRAPRVTASRSSGGEWRVRNVERNSNAGFAKPKTIKENWTLIGVDDFDPTDTYEIAWTTNTFTYAPLTNLTLVTEHWSNTQLTSSNDYNADGLLITNFNALGEETLYEYNGDKQLSKVTRPSGLVTDYAYDGSDFLSTIIDGDGTTPHRTNSYTYSNGLLLTHTDERGRSVTNSYDALGRLLTAKDSSGTIAYTYDKLDLIKVVDRMTYANSYVYDGFRQLTYHTNANSGVTTYSYCDCGSLTSVTDPGGGATSFTYDNLGRRIRTTLPGGSWMENTYALSGEVIRIADSAGTSVTNWYTVNGLLFSATNAFGRVFLNAYDDESRVIRSVDANGVQLGLGYDALGRLINRTNRSDYDFILDMLDAWVDRFDYTNNVSGPVATYRYHINADLVSFYGLDYSDWERIGELVVFDYDLFGRKTNEVHWNLNDVSVLTNAFVYHGSGDLHKLIDGKAQVTTWKYDSYGRVTNKFDAASTLIFTYGYDANGRLTHRWTPEKGYTYYSYDAVGNLTTINYATSPDITLGYDKLNRLTNMLDSVGTTAYSYTAFGALQSEDGPWADDAVSYSYTANRLRSALSLARPNASAWSQSYAYDTANRISTITSPAGVSSYEYGSVWSESTPAQLIRKLTLPNGSAITNEFDAQARWLGTTLRDSTGTLLNQHLYTYNDLDQRTQQTRTDGSFVDYGYDSLGQLVDATGKELGGTTNRVHERFGYFYDAAGNLNRRTNNALVQSFTVNNLNQLSNATRSGNITVAGATTIAASSVTVNTLTAERYADHTFARTNLTLSDGNNTFTAVATDSLGRGDTNAITVNLPATVSFIYDSNGNLRTNGTRTFEYDDENQLTRVTEPSAWKAEFTYDGKLRMRVSKDYEWRNGTWVLTNEVRRVYDGMLVIQERDGLNVPRLTYTRGKDLSGSLESAGGIGGLLALSSSVENPASSYSFHSDGNGNITALVDADENVVARYLYDPFGNTLSATGPQAALNKYRFSSKEGHGPSGMVYYGYRWYMPELQRWLIRDPVGELGFEAQHQWRWSVLGDGPNLYRFVDNSPVSGIDAYGLQFLGGIFSCTTKMKCLDDAKRGLNACLTARLNCDNLDPDKPGWIECEHHNQQLGIKCVKEYTAAVAVCNGPVPGLPTGGPPGQPPKKIK